MPFYFQLVVADQNASLVGDLSTMILSKNEYDALTIYVHLLRPKLCSDEQIKFVFTVSTAISGSGQLQYGFVYNIFQKCKTFEGKSLNPRTIRHSKVSNTAGIGASMDERDNKISSTDPEYRRLIEEAEVVPKCFNKKVGQKNCCTFRDR